MISAVTLSVAQNTTPEPTPKPLGENAVKIKQVFSEALSIIEENYVGGQKLDLNKISNNSISSMLQTLDPHSRFLDSKATEEFNSYLKARFFGIGMVIALLPESKENVSKTYIRTTFENSPATRAGLRYGDQIIEIDGVSMQGKSVDEVRGYVVGPRGTTVKIVVERFGKRETFEIVRDAISLPSIPIAYLIRPEIGYIAMTEGFSETTFQEFQKALENLKSRGMKQLILDLRNNNGGFANQARLVANALLPRGRTIYIARSREGKSEKYVSENNSPETAPLVVLTNRRTVSAAEILAGALQDNDRALFIGETTFGKGLIQDTIEIEKTSMLLLTTARYETPSGRLIQRDYSGENLSEYYDNERNSKQAAQPDKSTGAEFKTVSGRVIYGGGGIAPDLNLSPPAPNSKLQNNLNEAILSFSLDLAYGKIAGFEEYKNDRPIVFNYDLKPADLPVTAALYQAFRKFTVERSKIPSAQIDREREFIERGIRAELVTAAYGANVSRRVFNEADEQLKKAVEMLPQAKELAFKAK